VTYTIREAKLYEDTCREHVEAGRVARDRANRASAAAAAMVLKGDNVLRS
jgi:hypothetical protein